MSVRYVTGRFLPDKAIDVIDEACSRVRLSTLTAPPDLKALEDEIAAIAAKKEEAVKTQDFENAAKLRDEEKAKRDALEARKKEWSDQQTKTHGAITPDDVAAVSACATPSVRSARSCSSARPAWAKPSCPRRSRKPCSATRTP